MRSYILLADISAAKGDFAQAKATLNSIIDNYKGDPALVELAKQKLEQIEQMEKSGRRKPSTDTYNEQITNVPPGNGTYGLFTQRPAKRIPA